MNRIVESLYNKYSLDESSIEVKNPEEVIIIDVDWVVNDINKAIKEVESKFNIKVVDVQEASWADIVELQGTKQELYNYLTSDLYGMSINDIEEVYPELL